jgi:hypothetical protein
MGNVNGICDAILKTSYQLKSQINPRTHIFDKVMCRPC